MKYLFLLLICSVSWPAWTQVGSSSWTQPSRHILWGEGNVMPEGGPRPRQTLSAAVAYEHLYHAAQGRAAYIQAGLRTGIGIYGLGETGDLWWLHLSHHMDIGSRVHRAEATLGLAYFPEGRVSVFPYIQVGYRYQPRPRGLVLRVHAGTPGLGLSAGWVL